MPDSDGDPWAAFLDSVGREPAVVGVVLTGSRGRNAFVRSDSDWDVRVVVASDSDGVRARLERPRGGPIDLAVRSLDEFARDGLPGSSSAWDRYSYCRATVVVDRLGGRIRELVAAKARLGDDEAREVTAAALDEYVNAVYRSRKNLRAGLLTESHLDAVESIAPLLTWRFALERRVRPFNKFLRWELEQEPLPGRSWSVSVLERRLGAILSSGDEATQVSLYREVEALARERRQGDVIDAWEPDVEWLRSVPPPGD